MRNFLESVGLCLQHQKLLLKKKQILLILQALMSRDDERSLSALATTDFDYTMLIAKYLDGLAPEQDIEVLLLREKFCALCDSILGQRAFLGFRSECRNELLHKVSGWMVKPEQNVRESRTSLHTF